MRCSTRSGLPNRPRRSSAALRFYFPVRPGAWGSGLGRSFLRLLSIASLGLVGSSGSFWKPCWLETVSQLRSRAAFGSWPGGAALPFRAGRLDEVEFGIRTPK
jgi:hypothetical protein